MHYYSNIVLWTVFLAAASDKSDNNGCITPDIKVGECQLASECETIPFIRTVLKTLQQREYLKNAICGFEGPIPKICCPLLSSVPPVIQQTTQRVTTTNVTKPITPGMVAGRCLPTALPPNPNSKCCGMDGMISRIEGGNETEIEQYPWLVLLEYRDIDTKLIDTKCGGSLISGRYVLTAAQCVDDARTNMPESVRLGEYDTLNDIDCVFEICNEEGSTSIPIEKIIVHTMFTPGRHPRDDIALLRLTKMATFSDFIQPICLPSATGTTPTYLFVAGWGATRSGPRSTVKMHVRLPFVNLTTCNPYYHYQLTQDQVCAGGEIGKDACRGDAGGPLMQYTRRHHEVLGIVSYGSKPCGYSYPGVYTNVMKYLDWLRVNMHE